MCLCARVCACVCALTLAYAIYFIYHCNAYRLIVATYYAYVFEENRILLPFVRPATSRFIRQFHLAVVSLLRRLSLYLSLSLAFWHLARSIGSANTNTPFSIKVH